VQEKDVTILTQEFLQRVLDSIEESIVVIDRDYHITCHNNSFLGWLKKPSKKIIGESCYSVIHGHSVRCSPCIVRETFRTGQYFEVSHSHDLGGGKKVYHETKSYPVKDSDGEVKYAVYIFRDVSEKALIEEKVRELDKFKKKILDNAGIAINVLDKNGNIMSVNMGSEELFGYSEGEVKGQSHAVFYREVDGDFISTAMKDALEKGKFEGEATLVKKDKSEFPADLTLTIVEDDRGEPTAFIEIITDLTQLKKAEQVIKNQLEKLKKLDIIKEEYFYATSHEFKTPLTTIVSLTKMILDEKLGKISEKQREALDLVYCDSKRLRGSVQKILDISKIESGRMVYNIEKLRVSEIFDDVLETLKIIINAKNLAVNKKIEKAMPDVFADKDRLAIVIENLVNNAVKFTPDGGRIDITASKDGDNVLVEVHDTGVGIPPEDLKKVFEKYYQVKSGGKTDAGGSGLGLVICKRIVEDIGGRIWVESKPGQGSKFKFTLPTKKPKAG